MKGHVEARLDKLDSTTNFIYNEEFFSSMDIISNGLDNVAARRFIGYFIILFNFIKR